MNLSSSVILALVFLGFVGLCAFLWLTHRAKKKKAARSTFKRGDEDVLVGEKQHCDGYSAGTFYW